MRLLYLQLRNISVAIKKILASPIAHLLNIIVLSLLVCVLGSILVIGKTNEQWQKNNITYPQLMVYLNENITSKEVSKLEASINSFSNNVIKGYQYISKEQGLQELQKDSQLKEIVTQISHESDNHLPNILLVNTNISNPKTLIQLKNKISNMSFVNSVELDEQYAIKLSNLVNFINNVSDVVLVFFGICLVVVIYNLIQLQMLQSRDEITVSRLIGASNTFIMQPLIYYAIIQILLGIGVSFLLINNFINYINKLLIDMGAMFGKGFLIAPLTSLQLGQILIALTVFTVFAVFLAVQRILAKDHPR